MHISDSTEKEWTIWNLQASNYRSQWPRGLSRGSEAACLLGLWVRIPPGTWSVVCCQVEVSALGWSLVQRSPTECHMSECDREASKMRAWPTRGCCGMKKIGVIIIPILSKTANSLLGNVAYGLNKACFLSRMSWFQGTHKWHFIYTHKKSTAFLGPIFMKLINAQ
jgi:hypothetical protein